MHDVSARETQLLFDEPPSPVGGGFGQSIFLIAIILGIFYFLLIRPQQKQAKQHQALLAGLKKGDRVLTSSGIYGKVWAVKDDSVILEVARDVRIEMDKTSVRRKMEPFEAGAIKQKQKG